MALSEAQKRAQSKWQKKGTVMISMRLQRGSDADILAYLDGHAKQTVIKAALREYMANHPEGFQSSSAAAPDEEEDIDAWLNSD